MCGGRVPRLLTLELGGGDGDSVGSRARNGQQLIETGRRR